MRNSAGDPARGRGGIRLMDSRVPLERRHGVYAPGVPIGGRSAKALRPAARSKKFGEASESLWDFIRSVNWSVSYAAFLYYLAVVVTYAVSGGDVAIVVGLVGLLFEKERLRFPKWMVGFAVFIMWGVIGYSQSRFPGIVLEDGLIGFTKLWLIAFLGMNVLTTPARIRFFLVWTVLVYATYPIRGSLFNTFLYGYTELGRSVWNGIFENPNDYAALMLFPLGIAASLAKDRNRWIQLGAKASLVIVPIVIMLTRSRGGLLALALFAVLSLGGARKKLRNIAVLIILGSAAIASSPEAVDRFSGLWGAAQAGDLERADEEGSAAQRFTIWKVAGRIIDRHPVTGVGLGAYNYEHAIYARQDRQFWGASGERDVHSTYLRVLAESGYPGLLIFGLTVFGTLWASARTRRRARALLPGEARRLQFLEIGFWGFLVAAIFGSYAHLAFLWVHLVAIAALAFQLEHFRRDRHRSPVRRGVFRRPSGSSPRPRRVAQGVGA